MLSIGINGNQDARVAGSRLTNPVTERRAFTAIARMREEDRPPPSLVSRRVDGPIVDEDDFGRRKRRAGA
jgi:hypothetical protein